MSIYRKISYLRKDLGLSQVGLAYHANVSLPTIQNIEAGKANPSLSVLQAITSVLGYAVRLEPAEPDWDLLAKCGAPFLEKKSSKGIQASPELLSGLLKKVCHYLNTHKEAKQRMVEAVQGLLLAIYFHYPQFFRKSFKNSQAVHLIFPKKITPRLLKLKRISLSNISEYL